MISKTKFLQEIGCASGRLAGEINELIFNWHRISGFEIGPNDIDDRLSDDLYRAAIFWKNLVLSEADGFRDVMGRKTFHELLLRIFRDNEAITYFGILCPSYKKGIGAVGFAKEPGNTTYRAFSNLARMVSNTQLLGIRCEAAMFFADISVENFDKLLQRDWDDLEKIIWLDSVIAKAYEINFDRLSHYFPKLGQIVGREGRKANLNKLDVNPKAIKRSLWRDRWFYPDNFGWSIKEAEKRTVIHAHSYFWQGKFIRETFKNPVMIYSAYDYEKAGLYNGKNGNLLPCVVFPKKDQSNPPWATIPHWNIIKNDHELKNYK